MRRNDIGRQRLNSIAAEMMGDGRKHMPMNAPFDAYTMPEPNSGCHLWLGVVDNDYGRLKEGNRWIRAHRRAWTLRHGPIPDGMLVLHRCDNTLCVNPDHLFLGTNAQNIADRNRKGRQAKGALHGLSRIKFVADREELIKAVAYAIGIVSDRGGDLKSQAGSAVATIEAHIAGTLI